MVQRIPSVKNNPRKIYLVPSTESKIPTIKPSPKDWLEERKEMFYLMAHSTHLLRLYSVGHMVKDHSDSEVKPAADTWATLSY